MNSIGRSLSRSVNMDCVVTVVYWSKVTQVALAVLTRGGPEHVVWEERLKPGQRDKVNPLHRKLELTVTEENQPGCNHPVFTDFLHFY